MLFCRLSWPANDRPVACGVNRVRSAMFPDTVGIVAMSDRLTDVDAPVREELNTGSTCAVTVISSCTAIGCTENRRSVPTPRLTMMSTCVSGVNAVPPAPTYATVTLYGPPTLMPGIENRPSARVTASYVVPDGSWIAITLAPTTGSCWVLVTMPVTAPVVTPWAWDVRAEKLITAITSSTPINGRFLMIKDSTRGGCGGHES